MAILFIPLGILSKCETKHEDMVCILDHLHQYVPTMSIDDLLEVPGVPDGLDIIIDYFHCIPSFGGDLLTEMRAGTAKNIRCNSERGRDCLEGLIPVAEDWTCLSLYFGSKFWPSCLITQYFFHHLN